MTMKGAKKYARECQKLFRFSPNKVQDFMLVNYLRINTPGIDKVVHPFIQRIKRTPVV